MAILIDTSILEHTDYTAEFIEGVVLAANMTPKALDPALWISPLLELDKQTAQPVLIHHFQEQYAQLMACEYDVFSLLQLTLEDEQELKVNQQLQDFAQGFMTVWPEIEVGWNEVESITDGTVRMLQGLLMTMMLVMDEKGTYKQMQQAGIKQPPTLEDMLPQLGIMVNEVSKAADNTMQGDQSVRVNPYKNIGRNDMCFCGSGKKFKQCCSH